MTAAADSQRPAVGWSDEAIASGYYVVRGSPLAVEFAALDRGASQQEPHENLHDSPRP